ncbi:MAG: endonuclease III domain-containing protein [Adhaeribacter sp.]
MAATPSSDLSKAFSPAQKAWHTHVLLQELYGELPLEARREPMHELISTMLSHRTTHANEEKAYYTMLHIFGDWQGVLAAPFEALADAIAAAKFPGAKAANIQKALARIRERSPDFSLDFLAGLSEQEALAWLQELPGVGEKTARLLLLFNYHKPVLPVDTHVHRVSQRVGILGASDTAAKAHQVLPQLLPRDAKVLFNFHKHLYWHGQRICTWRSPKCKLCPLQPICNYYQQVRKKGID